MRRRLACAVLAVLVIGVGLLIRFGLGGDLAGGVIYTALVYLLVAALAPRMRPSRVASIALAWSVLMELLQAGGIAAALVALWSPLRLVLGTGFAASDLLAYLAGAVLAGAIDARVRRPRTRPRVKP